METARHDQQLKFCSSCGDPKANLRIVHLYFNMGNNILERDLEGGEDSKSLDHFLLHEKVC